MWVITCASSTALIKCRPWRNQSQGSFKGQWHEMNSFFEGLNILISTFCVCADGFQGLSKAFHYLTQILTFCCAVLNLLTNFGNDYRNPPQNSLLCDWSMFYSTDLSKWLQGKCARINLSQPASCKDIQCQNCRFRVFEAGYWKDFHN
jgi:hypothetical protein